MNNYLGKYQHLPPAIVWGKDGKGDVPHSWRVELLPFLGLDDLYNAYHFDEPWDSPNNTKILDKMPDAYRAPTDELNSTNTSYFALTGPGTMFDGKQGISVRDVSDGTANTILLVESKLALPWTKPLDIAIDADVSRPLPKFGGIYQGGFFAATIVDGAIYGTVVHEIEDDIKPETLRALITRAGNERVKFPD